MNRDPNDDYLGLAIWLDINHDGDHIHDIPESVMCRLCMYAALNRATLDGATDDEILTYFKRILAVPDLRALEATLLDVRSARPPRQPRRVERIATAEQAKRAYVEFGSERKAASALSISKTQLRRLLGKQE